MSGELDREEEKRPGLLSRILRWSRRVVTWVAVAFLTIYLVRAFDSRRGVVLEPWHLVSFDEEFRASDATEFSTFDDYLRAEDRLFDELEQRVYEVVKDREDLALTRYATGSPSDPRTYDRDWNRTFELEADSPRGGVLLIHGLTDSPYSLRRIGEVLHDEGFYVLGLRLPGHGTTPGALVDVRWRDWKAAVRLGARHVRERAGRDGTFHVVGYSLGGALALDHAIDAVLEGEDPVPDHLILLSPAVGITAFATIASWHHALSWIPFFRAFRWQEIEPEYDPFKYISFPKNAAQQMRALTLEIESSVQRVVDAGKQEEMPSMTAVQSLIDTTVLTEAIVTRLFDHVGSADDELVLYDTNREAALRTMVRRGPGELLDDWQDDPQRPYRLTVLTNVDPSTQIIHVENYAPGEATPQVEPLGIEWPRDVYSMSHIAIPFAPDDPVYGHVRPEGKINLGAIEPRGERGLLRISLNNLMRLRYNPFFDDLVERIRAATR